MVAVVQVKCPVNFVIFVSTGTDTDGCEELTQIYHAILITVICLPKQQNVIFPSRISDQGYKIDMFCVSVCLSVNERSHCNTV